MARSDLDERRYYRETTTFFNRIRETVPLEVLRSLGVSEGRILDLGCSFGATTVELAAIFGPGVAVEGIDLNKKWVGHLNSEAIDYYNAQANRGQNLFMVINEQVSYQSGDGFIWAQQHPDHYDAIFVLNSLMYSVAEESIDRRTLLKLLREVRTGLKPGGWLCVGATELLHSPYLIFQKENDRFKLRYHNGKELSQPTATPKLADKAISAANAIYMAAGV